MAGKKLIVALFALAAVIAAFAVPASADGAFQSMGTRQAGDMGLSVQQTSNSIIKVAEGMPDISMFVSALRSSGLDKRITAGGEYIVFAPTDNAIMKDPDFNNIRSMSGAKLNDMVQNFIVNKVAMPYQGGKELKLTTLGGKEIVFKMTGDKLTAGGVNVVKIIKADNGILAVTDGVPRI
jgi:uncharacterized surface protein with fasciclin (FAS1) repeats